MTKMKQVEIPLSPFDQVTILRALGKISSSFVNFDAAIEHEESIFSEELAEKIATFETYFKNITDPTFKNLIATDSNTLANVVNEFTNSDKLVKLPESPEREMIIALCKLKSAFIHDIYNLQNQEVINLYRKKFIVFGMGLMGNPELKIFAGPVMDKLFEAYKEIGLHIIENPKTLIL